MLAAIAAGLVVVGARWVLIERVGSPVPFQDQWYAEGEDLYLAAGRGGVPISHFFQAHNDHRIVPTRVLAYALFKSNDQWDVRVQMLANSLLAAALCFPLLALCRPWVSDVGFLLLAAMIAWFYSLPVLYENALWGFQSQFYFLVLFSLLQIQLTLGRRPYSFGWWCGLIAGVAALGSMGSGLLSSVTVAAITLWRIAREPDLRRELAPTLVGSAILAALGLVFLPPRIGGAGFDFQLFLHTIGHALDFPERGVSFAGGLVWLPFAWFVVEKIRSRETSTRERVLLATGAWVLLQVGAI
ncbi:MAG: hypothetical protein JWM88_2927, partial [Verrucomicrobia bacterium]|nr:hypothetical protein [Verrucomicrobiota bacterium]